MSNLIGDAPNQIPTNADLGTMAFQNVDPFVNTRSVNIIVPAGSGTVTLDTYGVSQFRTSKYLVQATYGTYIYASEILVTHDGTYVYYTEFGRLTNLSNGGLAAFTAIITGGDTINFNFTNNVGQDVTVTATRLAMNS